MSKPVIIYTDGSCKGNPGAGGWAAVFPDEEHPHRVVHGGEKRTTNNRMEITAAIKALEALTPDMVGRQIIIHSDSAYLVGMMNNPWWRRRYNQALLEQLDALVLDKGIFWRHVKGHSGNPGNEEADRLAQEEAEYWRSTTT